MEVDKTEKMFNATTRALKSGTIIKLRPIQYGIWKNIMHIKLRRIGIGFLLDKVY